jgi:Ankyrin repeats (many copies)
VLHYVSLPVNRNESGEKWWRCEHASVLRTVLMSDSEEVYEEWEKYLDIEYIHNSRRDGGSFGFRFVLESIIRSTAGHPNRERLLLSLWEKMDLRRSLPARYIGDVLKIVAYTTCSIKLAKFLIDHGADVNHGRSDSYMTPLHVAARRTSAEAAEMMKFLLFCGADPEAKTSRAPLRIEDEKGAKGISKWLGMSWNELVIQAKEEREKTVIKTV